MKITCLCETYQFILNIFYINILLQEGVLKINLNYMGTVIGRRNLN